MLGREKFISPAYASAIKDLNRSVVEIDLGGGIMPISFWQRSLWVQICTEDRGPTKAKIAESLFCFFRHLTDSALIFGWGRYLQEGSVTGGVRLDKLNSMYTEDVRMEARVLCLVSPDSDGIQPFLSSPNHKA